MLFRSRTLDRLNGRAPDARRLMRILQPFIVSVRRYEAERFRRAGFMGEPLLPGVSVWLGSYHPVRGLEAADEPLII